MSALHGISPTRGRDGFSNGRPCDVRRSSRPIVQADRTTGYGTGEDHLGIGADPGPCRQFRWAAGSGGRTGLVEGRRLPAVQRHPQQQADEIRARFRRVAVQGADEPREWADPGPPGQVDRLRTRQQTRHAAGTGRQHHGGREQLPGAAAQPAQRCGGEVRRLHLLHRSLDQSGGSRAVGPDVFRCLSRHARSGHDDAADRRLRRAQRACILAGRERALHQRFAPRTHPGV